MNGRDIMIERQTPAEAGNQYGKTTVRVKPNQTPITEDDAQLQGIFDNQADLTELYTEPAYDDLKEVLKNYLNPSSEEETETTTTETAKPSTNTSTPSATTATKTADVEDAFDQLFNS